MLTFPALKTGAVAQYPVKTTYTYRTDIVSFLDGSEQRFRNAPSVLHVWEISLSKLDERELVSIDAFFVANRGAVNIAFTDPWSGTIYPSCSIQGDEMDRSYLGPLTGQTRLIIRENRS